MVGQKKYSEAWIDFRQGKFAVWPIDGMEVVDDEPTFLFFTIRYQTVQLVDSIQVVAFIFSTFPLA